MNNNKERKKVTVLDFVLIAVLVCTALFIILQQNKSDGGELEVVVKKNSEVVFNRSLSDISGVTEICVDEEFNVIICMEPDGVYVKSSDCSDKVCVNTGKITKSGQAAVCLPAHVSVELKGGKSEVDVVVG